MNKKHIITGPPGSGKSSLIDALRQRGYDCMKEVSREVIIQEQEQQSNGTPWENMERFSQLVFNETAVKLSACPESTFCDRSLIDNIAYLKHAGLDIDHELALFPFDRYYHRKVFFALPWPEIYKNDEQRPEPFEAQLSLSKQLKKAYSSRGYMLIYLPFSDVNSRAEFVLEYLNGGKSIIAHEKSKTLIY